MSDRIAIVEMQNLPAAPGVTSSEVDEPGPWFGVQRDDDAIYGWWRIPAGAEAHAAAMLAERARRKTPQGEGE